jgi:anti-sigma regulatory factor (Ser/Thr protein kinase)
VSGRASEGSPRAGPTGPEERIAFELSATPDAGFAARRALLAGNGALPPSVRDDVLLLLTELVTNAVRHADVGPDRMVGVEFRQCPGTVRVAVRDEGAGFALEAASFRRDESGGWGLFLVDRIADRWAVTATATGTCVWFEIRSGHLPASGPLADLAQGVRPS